MAEHNRNGIFCWFLPALTEKQCSFGEHQSKSVNGGRCLSTYTSSSPAQGENTPRCTAILSVPTASSRAAAAVGPGGGNRCAQPGRAGGGDPGLGAAQGHCRSDIYTVLTDLFPSFG